VSGLIWNIAGPDDALAVAVVSARSARIGNIGDVLRESREDFALRAVRSQVLGSVCSDSDVVERWMREEPGDPDALLLYARTTVARALRAADGGDRRWQKLADIAMAACRAAILAAPADPTPLVALLSLARLGHDPQPGPAGSDGLEEIAGPWDLFGRVRELDPLHREAHIRFLYCLGSDSDRLHFAMHTANHTPLDSDPQLLVLNALVESYRSKTPEEREATRAERQWHTRHALQYSLDLYENWFPKTRDRRFPPITDYSYLAHALWAGERTPQAGDVFTAMGPYVVSQPWSAFGDASKVLLRARAQCHMGPPSAASPSGKT
jgi:hypothetical protein